MTMTMTMMEIEDGGGGGGGDDEDDDDVNNGPRKGVRSSSLVEEEIHTQTGPKTGW
jgi:hypothetical protein